MPNYVELDKAYTTSNSIAYSTASISPSSDRPIFAVVLYSHNTLEPPLPDITGAGLTWTRINAGVFPGGARFFGTALFQASGTPSAGALSIESGDDATAYASLGYIIFEWSDGDTADPLVQTPVFEQGTADANPSVSLPSAPLAGSATFAVYHQYTSGTITADPDWVEIVNQPGTQPISAYQAQWDTDGAQTANWTVSSPDVDMRLIFEIRAAGGGEIQQAISPAIEVDESQSVATGFSLGISPVIESNTTVSIAVSRSLSISPTSETDSGITLTGSKSKTIAAVNDVQSAEVLSTNIVEGINPAIETDLSAGSLSQSKSLLTAFESDLSIFIPAPNTINQSISPAFESNDFPVINWVRSKAVNTITEVDISVNVGTEIAVPIGFASDSSNAQSVIRVRHIPVSPASDISSTLTLTAGHSLSIAMAIERDAAVRNPNAPILLYPMIGISTLIEFLELLTHDYPMIGSDLWHEG